MEMNESYGVAERTNVASDIDRSAEEISMKGYTVLPSLLPPHEVAHWRDRIDAIYAQQEAEFGRDALAAINDLDVCRAPLLYDWTFIEMASNPGILDVARRILGDWIVLHLQNAIINRPNNRHHQAAWHRDLPYQNWTISKPLALSAIVAIDDFSAATGGTRLLPFSHQRATMPSEAYTRENAIDCTAPAGSVIIFDSMLFHQAGSNKSGKVRRAVNHVYTAPIIKQQYDFPRALAGKEQLAPDMAQLLGFTSQVATDDRAWRKARAERLQKRSER